MRLIPGLGHGPPHSPLAGVSSLLLLPNHIKSIAYQYRDLRLRERHEDAVDSERDRRAS